MESKIVISEEECNDMLINVLDLMFNENDKSNHPKLMNMTTMLNSTTSTKLLIGKDVNNDYNKALESLHKAKLKYIPNVILKKTINDVYRDVLPITFKKDHSGKNDSFAKSLKEMVSYTEAEQIKSCLQVRQVKYNGPLLGIINLKKPQWGFNESEELKRRIHLLLAKEAQSLVEFYINLFKLHDDVFKITDILIMAITLNENVRSTVEDIKRKQALMRAARVKLHDLIRECKNNLTNVTSKTNGIGDLQLNGKWDQSKLCLLQNKSKHLDCKLRNFQLEVFQHVHIPEVISSNDNISTILDDYRHRVQCRITKSKHRLAVYESLGPRFQILLATHTGLLNQIENKKEMLQQWQVVNSAETCQQ